MRHYAIILAGGLGKRMLDSVPKQFIQLHGVPVLMYSIKQFYQAILGIQIIVVLPENLFSAWKELCVSHTFNIPHTLVEGGPERFHSVKNGLSQIHDNGIVAIHDGARPLVSENLIKSCFDICQKHDSAVPSIEITDSVRLVDGAINEVIDRRTLRSIQTPQCFKSEKIIDAYRQMYSPQFTDDASVFEKNGNSIHLISGEKKNIKITFPEDITIAEALINS